MKELFYEVRDGYKNSALWFESEKSNAPLLIEIHGGAFLYGHNRDDKELCEILREKLAMNVVSLDYRLAPKFTFPFAHFDCFDTVEQILKDTSLHFDRERVYIIGHSAGANLAAGVTYLNLEKIKFKGIVLSYPFLDSHLNPRKRKFKMYSFPSFIIKSSNKKYFPVKEDRLNPLGSPVYLQEESLKKFPPTFILTCENDSLRADGIALKQLLDEAGAQCQHIEYKKTVHGFIEVVPRGKKWWILSRKMRKIQKESFEKGIKDIVEFFNSQEN